MITGAESDPDRTLRGKHSGKDYASLLTSSVQVQPAQA